MRTLALFAVFAGMAMPQATPSKLGVVSGTVTAEGGGPLSGVRVAISLDFDEVTVGRATVMAGEKPPGQTKFTDEQGRFTLENVAPGTYIFAAERAGYLRYGAPASDPNRTLLAVKEGQRISDLRIVMQRTGVIAGHVRRDDGEPFQNAAVYALRWTYTGGIRQLEEQGLRSLTDDRGAFRILNLPPGQYFVYAVPPWISPALDKVVRTVQPTFAPNALKVVDAGPVAVFAGGEGLAEIRLREDKQFVVRGTVKGQQSGAVVLAMEDIEIPKLGRTGPAAPGTPNAPPYVAIARTDAEGSFELGGLLQGRHRLYAFGGARLTLNFGPKGYVSQRSVEAPAPDEGDSGTAEVTISDSDIEGISIVLAPAAAITRTFRMEQPTLTDRRIELSKRNGGG